MNPQALLEHAVKLRERGDLAQAEPILRQLLAIRPGHPFVCFLLGGIRDELGDHAEGLRLGEIALKAKPGNPGALVLTGNALQGLGRYPEAVKRYDAVLAADPRNADVHNNRANALSAQGLDDAALASLNTALALEPGRALFWYNRGNLLMKTQQKERAVADFSQAIALQPGHAAALGNRGGVLVTLGRIDAALADYDAVLALKPDDPHALVNRGSALMHLKRYGEALGSYEAALARDPGIARMQGQMAIAAMHESDWPTMAAMIPRYRQAVRDGEAGLDPLTLISYGGDGPLMLQCARKAMAEKLPPAAPVPLWTGRRYDHTRLRIAYVSSDFHNHPVGYLMAPLLERHDRSRFEIIAISTGVADGGAVRRRVMAACDHFHDMGETTDLEVAQTLLALETDIAVDLNGHTYGARPGIFALRPAPVQATWLGFPGTTGVDFFDHVIADAVVAPLADQPFYSEKIVHLPGCVFPFDADRAIAAAPSRADEGLPQTGFVFCCFNRNWKLTAAMFDIWMRLLGCVPGSVLWLGETEPHIQRRLRNEAQHRGVDASRLVFAEKRDIADHLGRHALADLFLDTVPYNAHATAADALLAGLPLLTQLGDLFAGRVAASMVTAAGVPELVTHSAQEYEALALALVRDPTRLTALREKLMTREGPLFDSKGFVRGLEAVCLQMARNSGASPA